MARTPPASAADTAELSLLAGDSLDEGDTAPVSAAAGGGRALPPRRSRSAARTAIALEVVGELPVVRECAGSTRRGRGRLPGSRSRGRASAGRAVVVSLPVAASEPKVVSREAGVVPDARAEVRPVLGVSSLAGCVSGANGFPGAPILPSTSGAVSGLQGGTVGGWSPWGMWGSPWAMGPWASVPPSFPAVGPSSPWGPGFVGGLGGGEIRGEATGSAGLTYPPAVQVAGPCPVFSPQAVTAGRVAMAGTSTLGPVREGHAEAVRMSVEEPARTAQRPAMAVAAEGAASVAVEGGRGRGDGRITGAI
uniref:Collagen alpha-2(I) chain-like n=1 Tax=Geotrypetes seraphini TaxID=260995 RepID=A0A6P8NIK5_GEOSA|nr:collagen alpha-2(I) chain-like [Geotrypetes seraphini]